MKYKEDKSSKVDYTLLPLEALPRVVNRFQVGLEKYARNDWQEEVLTDKDLERYRGSLLRHTIQYLNGETDEDHLAAACATALIMIWGENKDWSLNKVMK